jgi:hypothetical protein
MFRMAALFIGAACAEKFSDGLRVATVADEIAPRTIATFSDFGTSLEAVTKLGEQPIYIGTKSAEEPHIYSRIVRILALSQPQFTTVGLNAAPTVLQLWPSIPKARAYVFAATDTYSQMAGPLCARDVALFIEYFCRLYGLRDEFFNVLQVVASFATRPAGAGALGAHSSMLLAAPRASLQPLVLTPLIQPTEVLGNEEPVMELEYPSPLLLQASMRAAVLLTSLNTVLMQAGGFWVDQEHMRIPRINSHYKQVIRMRNEGSAAMNSALHLAATLGWEAGFSSCWHMVTPASFPSSCLRPIETEECLPFIDALPATSAALAHFKPVAIDTLVPANMLIRAAAVTGRQSLTDAHYSVLGLSEPATLKIVRHTRMAATFEQHPVHVRESYRRVASDGQFTPLLLENQAYYVGIKMPSAASILESHLLKEQYTGTKVLYEWNIPFTNLEGFEQFIEDGYIPALPPGPAIEEREPMLTVPPGTSGFSTYTEHQRTELNEMRDILGADYGAILDSHSMMTELVGKQLSNATYESKSRELTGLLTSLEPTMIPIIMEGNTPAIRAFCSWMIAACEDAREWDYRPTSKDQLLQQQNLVQGMLTGIPAIEGEPVPPDPPTREQLTAAASLPVFSRPLPTADELEDDIAQTALSQSLPGRSASPSSPPTLRQPDAVDGQREGFHEPAEPVVQTPASVAEESLAPVHGIMDTTFSAPP